MSGLVLSSFFDFLRPFFAFAMPLSCLSIFFRPKAAAGIGCTSVTIEAAPAAQAIPF
jgi:hypothetical protein